MKFALILILVFLSSSTWALSENQFLSVKERLRLSLWLEGISGPVAAKENPKKIVLPEQLERALKKII